MTPEQLTEIQDNIEADAVREQRGLDNGRDWGRRYERIGQYAVSEPPGVLRSHDITRLAAALVKAQAALRNPDRNREVNVRTRDGGSYKFAYATLDNILDTIRGPLTEAGIALIQSPVRTTEGLWQMSTMLVESESGQWIDARTPIMVAEHADAQGFGSAMTYARRYGLALLPISAEEDDDANAASGNTVKEAKERHPRPAVATESPASPKIRDTAPRIADATGTIVGAQVSSLGCPECGHKVFRGKTKWYCKTCEKAEWRHGSPEADAFERALAQEPAHAGIPASPAAMPAEASPF